jgi:hypothetical protein
MDYINPEDRKLRDEPTLPLSPDEAAIAAKLYQEKVLKTLLAFASLSVPKKNNNKADSTDFQLN